MIAATVVGLVAVASLVVLPASPLLAPADAVGALSAHALDAPMRCDGLQASQGFGDTPYEHPHTGIDLVCPPGTAVIAVASGVFHQRWPSPAASAFPAGRTGGLGVYGELDVGSVTLLYGHLEGFSVDDSSVVAAGTVLGFEGDTGCSSGYHLHFEVHSDGQLRNPCPYLPADYPVPHSATDDRCWGGAPP